MIGNDPVSLAPHNHVCWRVDPGPINEYGLCGSRTVEPSHGLQSIAVQKPLHQRSVDFLCDAPILSIDYVVDRGSTREGHTTQVTEAVVGVGRYPIRARLRLQRPVGLVHVTTAAVMK